MASNALRIIALAYKEEDKVLSNNNLEENLIFIGLVGLIDPPRKDVYEAIRISKEAGTCLVPNTDLIVSGHMHNGFTPNFL